MRLKGKYIILITILIALSSCASQKSYTSSLSPVRENTSWYLGQEFMSDSIQGVIYDISYDTKTSNSYCFDLTITNQSAETILIDPAQFYYTSFNSQYKPTNDFITYSVDPSLHISRLSANIEDNYKKAKRNARLSKFAEATGFILGFFINGYNHSSKDEAAFLTATTVAATSAISADASFERLNELQGEFDYWTQAALLKNTLAPMQSVRGKVFFPIPDEQTAFLRLSIPLGTEELEFVYQLNKQKAKK